MDWFVVIGWGLVLLALLAVWTLLAFAAYGVYLLVS